MTIHWIIGIGRPKCATIAGNPILTAESSGTTEVPSPTISSAAIGDLDKAGTARCPVACIGFLACWRRGYPVPSWFLAQRDRFACVRLLAKLMRQESDHGRFLGLPAMTGIRELFIRTLLQRLQQAAIEIAVENCRMDIAFAADRRRVAEHLRDGFNRLQHVLLGFRLRIERFQLL